MKIFTEVSLPELCLPMEAVLWLALGRPPEVVFVDACSEQRRAGIYQIDFRLSEEHVANGGLENDPEIFPEDLEAMGIDVDYSKLADVADTKYWKDICRLVQNLIDQARARVFTALADGSLAGKKGVWKNVKFMEGLSFCNMQPAEWTMDILDKGHGLDEKSEGELAQAYISVESLIRVFPDPIGMVHRDTGERVLRCQIELDATSETKQLSSKRGRGRSAKSQGITKNALFKELERLKIRAELPAKKEALVQHTMDYCSDIGSEVSRSTAQRMLAEFEALQAAQK